MSWSYHRLGKGAGRQQCAAHNHWEDEVSTSTTPSHDKTMLNASTSVSKLVLNVVYAIAIIFQIL